MPDIWKETVNIRFGHIDRSDRLTLWSAVNFFQEAAISHAAELGAGRDALARNGQAWVLSRLSLFVQRRPAYGETVEVSTWPRRHEKLFALRDYAIRDAQGKALVRGRGGWLVLDMKKHKPLRVQPIVEAMPPNDGIDAFPAGPAGLGHRENLAKAGGRSAAYSDIDFNGHVNNARYIQWIQDITGMDALTKAGQIRLDINYLSEVMPGDFVELWSGAIEGEEPETNREDYPALPGPAFAYEGRRPESAQPVFRAELRTGSVPCG